jgi:hypothetical protein
MVSVRDDFALQLHNSVVFLTSLAPFGHRDLLQELGILTDQRVTQNQQFGGR